MESSIAWVGFPDKRLKVYGLPWFEENAPNLWRFPGHMLNEMPEGVCTQARFPSGGRIRFRCDGSRLLVRVKGLSGHTGHGIDLFVDNSYWKTGFVADSKETEILFFSGVEKRKKAIDLYLPYRQDIIILAIGVDSDTDITFPISFEPERPVVFYGSSVAQGVGAGLSGMSYEAVISRRLNVDFVNFGFGGAGKAEANVVEMVNQVEASCYILDLGKSYGMQSSEAYETMLQTIRLSHPDTPILCITPIFSARENYDSVYADLSHHTRNVVRQSAAGLDNVYIVDGLKLLGPADSEGFSNDGLHPSELGFQRIAERLLPAIRQRVLPGI